MNNKLLVKLIVPSMSETYEIFIPINKKIYEVIALLQKALFEISNGYYVKKDNAVLVDGIGGNAFDINLTVKESSIVNGSKVILL